jgi:hypothetical protein
MPSIVLSRSVAGTIHEHVGQSDQGNGRHAAGFPIQCQPGVLPINHRLNRVTSQRLRCDRGDKSDRESACDYVHEVERTGDLGQALNRPIHRLHGDEARYLPRSRHRWNCRFLPGR